MYDLSQLQATNEPKIIYDFAASLVNYYLKRESQFLTQRTDSPVGLLYIQF